MSASGLPRRWSLIQRTARRSPSPFGSRSELMPRASLAGGARGNRLLAVVPVELVGGAVLHDARDLADETFFVAGAPEEMEPHLHPRRDAARGDDAAGVDEAGAAHLAAGRDLGEPVDGRHAVGPCLSAVGLLAVGGRETVEEAHLRV